MFFASILTSPFIVHSANISHNRDTTLMMHHSTEPIKSSKLTLKKIWHTLDNYLVGKKNSHKISFLQENR